MGQIIDFETDEKIPVFMQFMTYSFMYLEDFKDHSCMYLQDSHAGFSLLLYDVVIQNCDTVFYVLFAVCVYNCIDWQTLLKPRFMRTHILWFLGPYVNYHINNRGLWKNYQWLTHLMCCSPTSVSSVQRISLFVTYVIFKSWDNIALKIGFIIYSI